jgi:hypothetical protein
MVTKTKKVSKHTISKAMTIPALRHSIEKVNTFVRSSLSKLSETEAVSAFQKEWKKVFGKDISKRIASDYVKYIGKRVQKGGSSYQGNPGADLQYSMEQPVGAQEPSVIPYVNQGFGFANTDSISAECGLVNTTPTVPADIGSGGLLVGGKRKTRKQRKSRKQAGGFSFGSATNYNTGFFGNMPVAAQEMLNRPFQPIGAPTQTDPKTGTPYMASSTPGLLQTNQMRNVKGYGPLAHGNFASPRPEIANLKLTNMKPVIYGAGVSKHSLQF